MILDFRYSVLSLALIIAMGFLLIYKLDECTKVAII